MNKLLAIATLFVCANCEAQNRNRELTQLATRFESITLPLNTRSLNKNVHLIANSQKPALSNSEVLSYLLTKNASDFTYSFEKFDMETGETQGIVRQHYKFHPVYKFQANGLQFFIVLRTSIQTQAYYLSIYDLKEGKAVQFIEINVLDAEDEYRILASSYIDTNLLLKVFRYEVNPQYLANIKDEIEKSIVTETVYQLGKTTKILNTKSKKSECSVSDFFERTKKCLSDDPMNLVAPEN